MPSISGRNTATSTGNPPYSIAAYWHRMGRVKADIKVACRWRENQRLAWCLTGDTLDDVNTVTVRDLRNNGGEVLRRVEHGERIVVTRDGAPVAELRPLPRSSASPTELIRRRKNLPRVNPDALRRDIDSLIDPSL